MNKYKIIEIFNENGKDIKEVISDTFLQFLFDKIIEEKKNKYTSI